MADDADRADARIENAISDGIAECRHARSLLAVGYCHYSRSFPMAEFEDLIGPLLNREGGYSNRSADRGGATNLGITQKTLDRWNATSRSQFAGRVADVRGMTRDIATAIYREMFWDAAGCARVPPRVCEIHFDAAVQHGVTKAISLLQSASGASADGVFGPNTKASVEAMEPALLLARYIALRYRYYGRIIINDKSQLVFMRGWMSRMEAFS